MTRIIFFQILIAGCALLGATQAKALVILTEREVACHSEFGDCEGTSTSIEPTQMSFGCQCYDNDIYAGSFIDELENIDGLSDEDLQAECETILADCEEMTGSPVIKEVEATEDEIQMRCETEYGYCDWTFATGEAQSWVECPCYEERDWGVAMDLNPEDINVRDMSRNCISLLENCEEESTFTDGDSSDTDSAVSEDTDDSDGISPDVDDNSDEDDADENGMHADSQTDNNNAALQNLNCSTISAGATPEGSLITLLFTLIR